MDLSHIKMVVTDMDGTLLNSKHEVSPEFFELFKRLNAKGIRFVAASGRQYHSIVGKLSSIKEHLCVIAENGALVKNQEEELLVIPIEHQLKNTLLRNIDEIDGAYAMLCGKYQAYFDGSSSTFLNKIKEYYENFEICDDLKQVSDEIIKIAVYHKQNAEEYIYPQFRKIENKVKVKVSGLHWIDLNHPNANKGNALQKLIDHMDIKSNEVLVFGDYNNDIEMLELADYSFAMKNAHPNVKKVANFETASNDDFGVERILEQLL